MLFRRISAVQKSRQRPRLALQEICANPVNLRMIEFRLPDSVRRTTGPVVPTFFSIPSVGHGGPPLSHFFRKRHVLGTKSRASGDRLPLPKFSRWVFSLISCFPYSGRRFPSGGPAGPQVPTTDSLFSAASAGFSGFKNHGNDHALPSKISAQIL